MENMNEYKIIRFKNGQIMTIDKQRANFLIQDYIKENGKGHSILKDSKGDLIHLIVHEDISFIQ